MDGEWLPLRVTYNHTADLVEINQISLVVGNVNLFAIQKFT